MIIIYVIKIMPFFHFVFLNFPQTVIITWHMHDFVNGSDPSATVGPICRTQMLPSPIDHIVSQQTYTYLLSFWDMLHNLCSFLPKMLCIYSVIFFGYVKSVLKFKCLARFIWLILELKMKYGNGSSENTQLSLKYNFLVQCEPKHGRHVKFSFIVHFVSYN